MEISPFAAGLLHPLSGWDHLVAMVMLGVWAGRLGGAWRWLLPASFVAGAASGAGLGLMAVAPPGLENAIALSTVALAAAAVARLRTAQAVAALGVFAVALLHGIAHGIEAPAQAPAPFVAAFVLATALLHAIGIALGQGVTSALAARAPRRR